MNFHNAYQVGFGVQRFRNEGRQGFRFDALDLVGQGACSNGVKIACGFGPSSRCQRRSARLLLPILLLQLLLLLLCYSYYNHCCYYYLLLHYDSYSSSCSNY